VSKELVFRMDEMEETVGLFTRTSKQKNKITPKYLLLYFIAIFVMFVLN